MNPINKLKKMDIQKGKDFKILNITHNDLDGVSTDILLQSVFGDSNVKTTAKYLGYNEVENYIAEHKEIISKFDFIIVTDLCIKEPQTEIIDFFDSVSDKLVFIDHHIDSMHLAEKDYVAVVVENEKGKASATSLLGEYLDSHDDLDLNYCQKHYAEQVRLYDTWEWKVKYPKKQLFYFEELLRLLGASKYKKKMLEKDLTISKEDREIEDFMIQTYLKTLQNKLKKLKTTNFVLEGKEIKIGIISSDRYISVLGNDLVTKTDVDMIAIYNFDSNTVSYRSDSDDIKVNEFAKLHGGGGHHRASGSPLTKELIDMYFQATPI